MFRNRRRSTEFRDDDIVTAHRLVNSETRRYPKDASDFRIKYRNFMYSPRSHFVYETVLYCVFLILFSYMMLCQFKYSEMKYVNEDVLNNNSNSSSNGKNLFYIDTG